MAQRLITELELPLGSLLVAQGSLLAATGDARAYPLASTDLLLHPSPGRQRL